jgi:hypothetical protein
MGGDPGVLDQVIITVTTPPVAPIPEEIAARVEDQPCRSLARSSGRSHSGAPSESAGRPFTFHYHAHF